MKSLDLDFLQLKKKSIYTHNTAFLYKHNHITLIIQQSTSKQIFHKENRKRLFVLLPYPALSKNMNTDDV